jgi:hypothetical protein
MALGSGLKMRATITPKPKDTEKHTHYVNHSVLQKIAERKFSVGKRYHALDTDIILLIVNFYDRYNVMVSCPPPLGLLGASVESVSLHSTP